MEEPAGFLIDPVWVMLQLGSFLLFVLLIVVIIRVARRRIGTGQRLDQLDNRIADLEREHLRSSSANEKAEVSKASSDWSEGSASDGVR